MAGAVVLVLFELAFHPPIGGPVPEAAVALWDALAGLAPTYIEGLVIVVVLVPVLILIASLLNHSDTLDAVAFDGWSLPPLVVMAALYLWVSAATERRGLFLPARIGALDREIGRIGRARRAAAELVAAQRPD